MSGQASVPGTDQQPTDTIEIDTTASAAVPPPGPFLRPPPPPQSFDPATVFKDAYECAKLNNDWNKVSSSLMIHPDWLSKIPEGRRWTMLHQIVFSGNVMHLNEVLALQASNPQFRLLLKALDDKTVREVAAERAHIHPQMMRRIERLVAVDQLLNNAKDGKWQLVRQFITQQPDIVNEKPPYRRYYLAHHLAYTGQLDIFQNLSQICQFKLDLLADNKKINEVAREHNHIEFAEYIENLIANTNNHQTATTTTTTTTTLPYPPGHPPHQPYYSPGFHDNPGMSILPANLTTVYLPTSDAVSYPGNHHYSVHDDISNTDNHFATHSLYQGHNPATMTMPTTHGLYQGHNPATMTMTMPTTHTQYHGIQDDDDNNNHGKSVKPKSSVPSMTDDEQNAYEKTVMNNISKMSEQNLLNSITCCITKAILHDPVVAADGFTYEREAILNWFDHSNRSPMTNQELESLELKPNYAIKSILQLLHDPNNPQPKTNEKSKASTDNTASAK